MTWPFFNPGWKYFTSKVGWMVLTLPPSSLPENASEKNSSRPPVGLMGLLMLL